MPPSTPHCRALLVGALCAWVAAACDRGVIELLAETDTLETDSGTGGAGGGVAAEPPDAGSDRAPPEPPEGQCADGTDCADPTPVCDPDSRTCVPCRCPRPFTCDSSGSCVIACGPGGACPDFFPICDPSRNACVQCVTSAECQSGGLGPLNQCFDGICGQCDSDTDCPFDRPHCNELFHMCIDGCFDDSDCPLGSACSRGRCR